MNDDEPLSTQGERRRQQILSLAKNAARSRRRRRWALRGVSTIVELAIVVLIVSKMRATPRANHAAMVTRSTSAPLAVVAQSGIAVHWIQTDPTITDRLTLPPVTPRWTSIGDQDLLNELAAAGQPAGIVCMGGKTILLPR